MSDAKRIRELLLERVAELAPYLFPNGHREGNHWLVGNIAGDPGKSFKICIDGAKAGWWGDFADSKRHSRNLLDLWMAARNVDFKTALREASEWLGEPSNRAAKRSASTTQPKRTFATVNNAIACAALMLKMRETRRDWYHDAGGNEHFVVVRFDNEKDKSYRPFHRDEAGRWVMADPPGKLPLFNLQKLLAPDLNPLSEPVFVVEGEKCVCELETLGVLVTTSAHGSQAEHKTDWRPLAGRVVVILPDNDETGQDYAATVMQILMRLSARAIVKIVQLPGLPKKGDCIEWLEARKTQTRDEIKAELLELIKNAEVIREEQTAETKPKKEKRKKESAASQLVAFVIDQGDGQDGSGGKKCGPFSLFHDPHDRAFARYQAKDHLEIWPVESAKFKKILARLYYSSTGKIINRNSLADAVTTLAGLACHDNPEEPTFLRVAPLGENILIDLCDQKWRVVLVTAEGWQILDESPVAFVRTGSMRALPDPRAGGGSIEPLWQLLNVTKAQRPLVAAALLNGFHAFGPYFVANYVGEHGSAKTSAARIHRQLIDPNQNPLRSPPKEENDLFAQAVNNRCVALDNLSHLPLWLSDALCRTATGGGLSKRTLYTDTDETSLEIKRPVIMNGIEDVATRPDLADRVLQIELEEIPNKRRITEKVLLREFEKARPVIFTAILDAVSMALRTLPTLKMPPLPRMADAAEWATAGETAFGFKRWTFLKAYQRNLDESAEVAVDANPVGAAIRVLLEKQEQWEGEPRELLEALVELVSEKAQKQDDWPKNPQKLGQILRRIAPALRRAGIGYERPPRGKSRIIRLSRAAEKPGENDDDTDADSPHLHVV
jgi:putative DNA primase/helicase